jgi:hypothetical protein
MKRIFAVLAMFAAMVLAAPLWGEAANEGNIKEEATSAFEKILDLWRDGNYDMLYDRTLVSGKDTKQSFTRKMAAAPLKPSCCWEKMQDVSVMVKSPTSVVIRAKIGLDAPGEMEYKTKSFKLMKEFGEWRISRVDILSMAEAKKPKKSRKPKVVRY